MTLHDFFGTKTFREADDKSPFESWDDKEWKKTLQAAAKELDKAA